MASYQDLEGRMRVIEDKIEFLLRALPITLNKKGAGLERSNMLELYRLMRSGVGSVEIKEMV